MTGISTLGQALDQIERIKDQQSLFSSLSTQLASGKKTQTFSGLGIDILTSKRARADFKSLDTYINNIKNADRRISLMVNAVDEFKAQAKNFADALVGFSQEGVHQKGDVIYYDDPLTAEVENTAVGMTSADPDVDLRTLQDLAANILNALFNLLNAKEGDRYLLGGAETLAKPIENSGALNSALNTLIGGWKNGAITTDNFIADLKDRTTSGGNTDAITDTIVGYSAALSGGNAGNIFVRVSQTSEIEYTVLANDKAFRDIIVAASYIQNGTLPPIADTYEPPNGFPGIADAQGAPGANLDEMKENFFRVFNELTGMVNQALDDIDALRFKLAGAQARITQIKNNHIEEKNVLFGTISDIENADINEVSVKITTLQTQLEASFRVTAITQQLTLANFLALR